MSQGALFVSSAEALRVLVFEAVWLPRSSPLVLHRNDQETLVTIDAKHFMEPSSQLPPIPAQNLHQINDFKSRPVGRGYRIRSRPFAWC